MNRLHAEGERRSNDFGHRTIADNKRARKCPPQYTAHEKNVSKKGRQGRYDRRIPQVRPPIPADRARRPPRGLWMGSIGSIGFVYSMTKGLPELLAEAPAEHIPGKEDGIERRVGECPNSLTLEPDESDHFRIRPARFAVQPVGCVELAMMHRPASRCDSRYLSRTRWVAKNFVCRHAAGDCSRRRSCSGMSPRAGPLLMFWEMLFSWYPPPLGLSALFSRPAR